MAVLLCNPFGQEAVRIHRFGRVLAERFARVGLSVLRFDYFGTGDSPGDDEDGEVIGWVDDVRTAHEELLRRSQTSRVTWIGMRLGATIAMHAATLASPARVVLWEPVVDGARYLESLRASHLRSLTLNYGFVPAGLGQPMPHEAIGFAMSAKLRQQLLALDAARLQPPSGCGVDLILPGGDLDAQAWAARRQFDGGRLRQHRLDHAFEWTSEEALNTALVPAEALSLLIRLIETPT